MTTWLQVLIGVFLGLLASGEARAEAGAEVKTVEGEVSLARAGSKRAEAVFEGMQIPAGARVETGEDSTCSLLVGDVAIIDLEPGSVFRIPASEGDEAVSRVEVVSGGLWALVENLGRGKKFEVMTRTAVAGVKGTQFRAFQHPRREAEASFLMVEGAVQLRDRRSGRILVNRLTAGQKGSLTKRGGPVEVTEVDTGDMRQEFGDYVRPRGDLKRFLDGSTGGGRRDDGGRGMKNDKGGDQPERRSPGGRGIRPGVGSTGGFNPGPRVNPMPNAPPPPPPPPPAPPPGNFSPGM